MLFTPLERRYADAMRRLTYANPFDADEQQVVRAELESMDLGLSEEEARRPPVVCADPFPSIYARRNEALLLKLHALLKADREPVAREERERYEDLLTSALHLRYFAPCDPLQWIDEPGQRVAQYKPFAEDLQRWTRLPQRINKFYLDADHAFACISQYRLAVGLLQHLIRGESRPVMRLRADTWHSIFPRELRIYGLILFERMHEVTTLILGPSGTGKELVATAIGLARFVPFDGKRERFVEPFGNAFHPINLSAMPRDLIESEMFGHTAGAFTGATKDREGWFEKCQRGHTVFLDELGELAESVQVRLLRVLQNREFHRVGDMRPRRFEGRVIAATNRDLSSLIAAGAFREDLYFRLCSDVIRTPSLREQLDDSPGELPALVGHIAARCLGPKAGPEFVERLTQATLEWIEQSPALGPAYAWPGNFRELEQCVRSVMVRGKYEPPRIPPKPGPAAPATFLPPSELDRFAAEVKAGNLTMDELLTRYCSLIQARTGNLAETARRLKKHRLTVQGRVKPEWVAKFRGQ